jgi:cysteinyl-tRNA synthetase
MHNGMLMIRGEEMHKSLGNFITLEQAFERWDPMVIRFFVLLSHYRGPLDMSEEALDGGPRLCSGSAAPVARSFADASSRVPARARCQSELTSLLEDSRLAFEAA